MKATLEKMYPKETKLKIEKLPKELTVNKITLADDAWLINEFGSKEGIEEIFNKADVRAIMRILYRLLTNEDKIYLKSVKVVTVDEDGEETEFSSGVDKLLHLMESEDIEKVVRALLMSRGKSLPDLPDDATDSEIKKKAMKHKK